MVPSKRWILLAIVALTVALLVYALFEIIVVAIVSAAVASLVALGVYRYLEDRKKPDAPPPRPSPRERLLDMLGRLVDLNIRIRERGLADAVVARVEGIIDKLRAVLEDINERHPDHELTWTLNQMASEYLPKVMNPYLALPPEDRERTGKELLRSLDGLEAEVDNVADLVRGDMLGDFKAKAAFLRARFVKVP